MKTHSSVLALVVWWIAHCISATVAIDALIDGDVRNFANGGIMVVGEVVELAKYGSIHFTKHVTNHVTVNLSLKESAECGISKLINMASANIPPFEYGLSNIYLLCVKAICGLSKYLPWIASAANVNPLHIGAASAVSASSAVAVRSSARSELISVEGSKAKMKLKPGPTPLYLEEQKSVGSSPHHEGIPDTDLVTAQTALERILPEGDNITAFEVYSLPLAIIPMNETHALRTLFSHHMIILTTTSGFYISAEKWDDRISVRKYYSKKHLIVTTEHDCLRFEAEKRVKIAEGKCNSPPEHVTSYVMKEIPKGYSPVPSLQLNCKHFVNGLTERIRPSLVTVASM